jgi:predicted DNA-binding ribbon-helix-helix protein
LRKVSIQRSVRFDPDQYAHLSKMATARQCAISDVLREIIKQHLDGITAISQSHLRMTRLAEYTQVAVDTLLREEHPEHRKLVMDEVNRRMERYHGVR